MKDYVRSDIYSVKHIKYIGVKLVENGFPSIWLAVWVVERVEKKQIGGIFIE